MNLHSEYVIRTLGGCFEIGYYTIVMEYGAKGALSKLLREPEACNEADARAISDWGVRYQIALDIARGMAYLHNYRPAIIHADLKSDNVIIDQSYRAKLSDFGCSKLKPSASRSTLFGPKWAGTSPWMAPEVLDGDATTTASDSYSFGVTLWELGNRKIPFAGKKESQIINLVVNQNSRDPISADTPPNMAQLITRCWSKEPAERPTLSQAVDTLSEEYKQQFKRKK
jgi:serine/threonine protein kinase